MMPWALVSAVVATVVISGVPQAPIRTTVSGVRVDVLVEQGGTPVAGLTAENFRVREHGRDQTVSVAGTVDALSIVLVVDSSYSLRVGPPARWQSVLDAATAVAGAVTSADEVSVLHLRSGVRTMVEHTSNPQVVRETIAQIAREDLGLAHMWDVSPVGDAVLMAAAVARAGRGRPVVVLISDVVENASYFYPAVPLAASAVKAQRSALLDLVRDAGVVVETLLVPRFIYAPWSTIPDDGAVGDIVMADAFSRATGGRVVEAGASNLRARLASRFTAWRAGYVLTYVPDASVACTPGEWRRIDVRLVNARGRVDAPEGYRCRAR